MMDKAIVYTPTKLSDQEKLKAKNLVKQLTGESLEEVSFLEDQKLIDGLKIIYKDKLWDLSLQNQLSSIVETK